MRISRLCKICGKEFSAIKVTQFFCSRKCFKRDYYLRTRLRIQEQEQNPHYPIQRCSYCCELSSLNFDPTENPRLFDSWGCPHCGLTNQIMWKYSDNPNSFEIITSILVTFQAQTVFQSNTVSIPFRLPAGNPEKADPNIIVMTCDPLNISDIQKKNRKKILFS